MNIRPEIDAHHRVDKVLSFLPVVRIGTPHPITRRRVRILPCGSGGESTLACGTGGGGVLIPTRGWTWYTLGIYVLCGAHGRRGTKLFCVCKDRAVAEKIRKKTDSLDRN